MPNSYNSYKGAWGIYPNLSSGNIIVSDMQTGLYILDYIIPNNILDYDDSIKSIYPNPISEKFKVNCLAKRIEILDLYGKKIKEEDLFLDNMIYRNNISNGLYIYRLYDKYDNEIENGKIIFE